MVSSQSVQPTTTPLPPRVTIDSESKSKRVLTADGTRFQRFSRCTTSMRTARTTRQLTLLCCVRAATACATSRHGLGHGNIVGLRLVRSQKESGAEMVLLHAFVAERIRRWSTEPGPERAHRVRFPSSVLCQHGGTVDTAVLEAAALCMGVRLSLPTFGDVGE